mmetsp:Transcript_18299/g.27806  ORF Transcript_18299/g.27806 Transcript_18299/m.27806 type:complete len:665 (-) Transcript_18299:181-2175(-)|eukprot:CAMPEP_0194088100 /NCGR_PEP_ID=MMETSP0149-20130528/27837_1 /TAXON_ID=122233 /ORGANISM="Chaetoceros debilis, Strain MM31A-1" /LENGTH=664 /DNA_ID=CAMNT_0038771679 /DNA_START=19 /DNA_END=2013 /DNA_ORIENTATION=+
MAEEIKKQRRKRLKKKSKSSASRDDQKDSGANSSGVIDGDSMTGSGSTPTALIIVALVLGVYVIGFVSTIASLPDIKPLHLHLNKNMNGSSISFMVPIGRKKLNGSIINLAVDKENADTNADADGAKDDHLVDGMKKVKGENKTNKERLVDGIMVGGDDADENQAKLEDMVIHRKEHMKEDEIIRKGEQVEARKNKKAWKSEADAAAAGEDTGIDTGNGTSTPIPIATWPVTSTSKEKDKWLSYPHPGDGAMTVEMPPFWSKPIHDNKLMTRERAMQIGSCIKPDQNGSHQRGDKCPVSERTIFVAIASYRDWQCKHTVTSIFSRAKHPERIRVAVVDQIVDGDDICNEPIEETCETQPHQDICTYADQIDVYSMDAPMAVGPVFARHIGHRQYRGEYYYMQSDAHVTFTQDWDVDIVKQMEATGNDMTVLTTYLTDIVGSIDEKTGASKRNTRPIMCNTDYEGGAQGKHLRHMSQPERMPPSDLVMPQLEPWWAAGFSFSRGHFVVNVPYDQYQPMIFQGEEMSIGIRGFTIGYDYYAPQRSVCFHHYAAMNTNRNKVPHFWENSKEYAGTGIRAMSRLLGIVHMNPEKSLSSWDHIEEDIYGIGKVRTPELFYITFGIDVMRKVAKPGLCNFVEKGKMHRQFQKYLRPDGIGIDYSKIKYKL